MDPKETNETLDAVKAVGTAVEGVVESAKETAAKVQTITDDLEMIKVDGEKDLKAMAAQVNLLKTQLAKSYGVSGAEDFLMDMSKWIGAIFAVKCGKEVKGSIGGQDLQDLVVGKVAADYNTTTAATAGYLLPSMLMPGIRELKDLYGNFYPLVTKVTGTAGQSINMNKDTVNPLAYWRKAQNAVITPDAAPMTFEQETLVSVLCGSTITISNELLLAPGVNFSAVATVRMLKAIMRKLEFGMIAGAVATEPSNGIIEDATDQGTLATMTFATLITFLKNCVADNTASYGTSGNTIFMTEWNALALAGEQGSSTGALVWGDPQNGVPHKLMGYNLVTHEACNNGTSRFILLGDPSTITLVESAGFSVDISGEAGADSFANNESVLRAFNHYDWSIGQAAEWHQAVITA